MSKGRAHTWENGAQIKCMATASLDGSQAVSTQATGETTRNMGAGVSYSRQAASMLACSVMMSGKDMATTRGRTVANTKAGGTTVDSMVLACFSSPRNWSTDLVSGRWVDDSAGSRTRSVTRSEMATLATLASSLLNMRKALKQQQARLI